MKPLHIVQGDKNYDKAIIEKLAKKRGRVKRWVVPKASKPGDDVVMYIGGYGFFATGVIDSDATPRSDWPNRYGAGVRSIRLIKPAISLGAIRRHIPSLSWARYPRSITTPDTPVANEVRQLIQTRRRKGLPDLDDNAIEESNIDELRAVAIMRSRSSAAAQERKVIHRARSKAIKRYVLLRSGGNCEFCDNAAPFETPDGSPYLEPHHTTRLADDGPDHPSRVIALCPNCHRRAHHAEDAKSFNETLKKLLRQQLEP